MKRLLIATTAVGLCLAAPAFAQNTTDQDQLNKQRANQPSTSAPATQAAPSSSSSTNQQGSTQSGTQNPQPSPSAQAPSSNQRGQAQNQPSSNSPTNAQAPASSGPSSQSATTTQGKDSNKNRAQNKRQPADSSTSAQAPSSKSTSTNQSSPSGQAENRPMQNDRRDSRASRSDRSSASLNVNINDQQRTRIASVIGSSHVRPVNVNFRLDVGIAVPRRIALHTLPVGIVEVVPQYRGYRYFVARDQIVIVEPRRQTIVAVLPAGGTARAQATGDRVQFTDQQREVIRKRASSLRSIETSGSATHYVVEEEIPATVELQEFPAEIVTEVPTVRTYRYYRQNNDVLVVDPTRRRVIEVIR